MSAIPMPPIQAANADHPANSVRAEPFDGAQDRPFDGAQDRPFDGAQDRPVEAPRARHPMLDLLSRYAAVFNAAWTHRAELAGPRRLSDEIAFLPAALSLQDTPVHPAPRRLAFAIMALFVAALLWALLGQIDVVAVAPGRIVVSERTKLVQPLERSVVKSVLVRDGDHVDAGQALVELDATSAQADRSVARDQMHAGLSEVLRARALTESLRNTAPGSPTQARAADATLGKPTAVWPGDWSAIEAAAAHAQMQAEWRDIAARLVRLASEASRRQAEIATAQELVGKLETTVPLALVRETDFRKLVEQGYISGHATQDKTRERVELERDLATQRARLGEAQAALIESESARASYLAEVLRSLSEREAQGRLKVQLATQEQAKATQREKLTTLTAPVAGVVQQLAAHSVGGVVTEAQVLMVIVPDGASVTAEVTMDNKDIGFVHPGQSVEIKLETFPYTRYGTVPATVQRVTSDAVNDEKRGAIFPATLALGASHVNIDGKMVRLSPGMNVTAEIKTGQRRVIDFLLSPIQKAGSESLRER